MMKKTMVTLLMLGALTACNSNNDPKPKEFTLDPDATVLVSGKESKAEAETETLEYIVKNVAFIHRGVLNSGITDVFYSESDMGLYEDNYNLVRDLEGYKFKFFGYEVIDDGKPGKFFNWVDVAFTVASHNGKRLHPFDIPGIPLEELTEDTVAYIPNSVARECKKNVMKAFEEGDLEECYRIFREDYNFVPITGPELRKLKEAGLDEI